MEAEALSHSQTHISRSGMDALSRAQGVVVRRRLAVIDDAPRTASLLPNGKAHQGAPLTAAEEVIHLAFGIELADEAGLNLLLGLVPNDGWLLGLGRRQGLDLSNPVLIGRAEGGEVDGSMNSSIPVNAHVAQVANDLCARCEQGS